MCSYPRHRPRISVTSLVSIMTIAGADSGAATFPHRQWDMLIGREGTMVTAYSSNSHRRELLSGSLSGSHVTIAVGFHRQHLFALILVF
ncbi:hypothetical protein BDR03DRAFT_242739 [Suillus americanus]|nr:hypothetical protein BDR03DRAFT_242739 [Suillus americanus]